MTMAAQVHLREHGPVQASTLAWYVGIATLLATILDVLGKSPSTPPLTGYLGIYIGLVPTLLFIVRYIRYIEVRAIELFALLVLTMLVPISFLLAQDPLDIFGNYLRFTFPLLAVGFWSVSRISADRLISALYPVLWKVTLIGVAFHQALASTGYIDRTVQHFPALLFLFAVALKNGRYGHLAALVALSFLAGKDAMYMSMAAMIAAAALLRHQWFYAFLIAIFILLTQIFQFNPIFYVLYELGGNFARLGDLISDAWSFGIDEREFDAVTSNRFSEYNSIWYDWEDNGIPWLGRGLGATVMVKLSYANVFVERSTLHNSYLVAFQTLGVAGLLYLWRYFLSTAVRISRISPTLFFAQVGILTYAFFSNTLFTQPAIVMIAAASWHFAKEGRIATQKRLSA